MENRVLAALCSLIAVAGVFVAAPGDFKASWDAVRATEPIISKELISAIESNHSCSQSLYFNDGSFFRNSESVPIELIKSDILKYGFHLDLDAFADLHVFVEIACAKLIGRDSVDLTVCFGEQNKKYLAPSSFLTCPLDGRRPLLTTIELI